jgi:hypothetical protein
MGHSDISVTMNTYTHLGLEEAVSETNRLQQLESAWKEQVRWKERVMRSGFRRRCSGLDKISAFAIG